MIDKATAKFFFDQCFGHRTGEYCNVANNSTLSSLGQAHGFIDGSLGIKDQAAAIRFLRDVVDHMQTIEDAESVKF